MCEPWGKGAPTVADRPEPEAEPQRRHVTRSIVWCAVKEIFEVSAVDSAQEIQPGGGAGVVVACLRARYVSARFDRKSSGACNKCGEHGEHNSSYATVREPVKADRILGNDSVCVCAIGDIRVFCIKIKDTGIFMNNFCTCTV